MKKETTAGQEVLAQLFSFFTKEEDEAYYNDNRIHYSGLKALDNDVRSINPELSTESTDAMKLGSAFDLCVEDKEVFKTVYKVRTQSRPTAMLGQLADALVNEFRHVNIKDAEAVCQICNQLDLWKTTVDTKKESRMSKLEAKWNIPEFINYVEEERALHTIPSDFILEYEDYNKILVRSQQLVENLHKQFGKPSNTIHYIWQPVYKFDYKSKPCSIKLDLVIVNTKTNTLTLVDVKYFVSGTDVYKWVGGFYRNRYDIQGIFYSLGIEDIVAKINANKPQHKWNISPYFYFAVACPNDERTLIYEMPRHGVLRVQTINGFYGTSGYYNRGIIELMDQYTRHMKEEQFEHRWDVHRRGTHYIPIRNSEDLFYKETNNGRKE